MHVKEIKKLKTKFFSIMVFSVLACKTATIFASDIIPSNSNNYYRLGGGADISIPPVSNQQSITLGADANTDLSYSCDGFNPAISVSNTINNMDNSLENLTQAVISSATGAIADMPMYVLEKASPELYNLIQNTLSSAQDTFDVSMKSCQSSLDAIKNNKSPYQDWFSISDSQGWLHYANQAKSGQDVDINTAKDQITKDPKQYGIPWVHHNQPSGGSIGSQAPIHVIYDVVVAGYNVTVDQDRALDNQTPAPSSSPVTRYWATPNDAGKWSQLVLGEITVTSDPNQQHNQAGMGLSTLLTTCPNSANNDLTCVNTIQQKLAQIVSSNATPSADDLEAVSSPNLVITPGVITAIRNRTPEDQTIAVSKLSEDVAIQNLVDEALLLRQLLLAGSETQSVHNVKPALYTIQATLNALDKNIDQLKQASELRDQMTTHSVEAILNSETEGQAGALGTHEQTQMPETDQGAIYKN